MNRRDFLKAATVGTLGLPHPSFAHQEGESLVRPTPREIKGPFYPLIAQQDKDFDLTQVGGRGGVALGEHIIIEGGVFDTDGRPVEGATVDLWQANAAGRYSHPHDTNSAPVDDNFQGWAIVPSGTDGKFRFKTVFPGAYPVNAEWSRPPHIHFKVTKPGYIELVTQMYFPGQALNQVDRLLQRKSQEEQPLMIADEPSETTGTYYFRIVLEKA